MDGSNDLSNVTLYYGCRHTDLDYLYKSTLEQYAAENQLTIKNAFSRQDGHPQKYVQDHLKPDMPSIVSKLSSGAVLYLCGDQSSLSKDVRKLIENNSSKDQLKKWTENKQIREDLWS